MVAETFLSLVRSFDRVFDRCEFVELDIVQPALHPLEAAQVDILHDARKLTISRAIRAAVSNARSTIRKSQNRPKLSSILALR